MSTGEELTSVLLDWKAKAKKDQQRCKLHQQECTLQRKRSAADGGDDDGVGDYASS